MTILRATLATLGVAALLLACGSADSNEPTDSTNEDLKKHCVDNVACIVGDHWDSKACKCVPDTGGVKCGTKTCGSGEYCCSSSCGICEKIGAMCPAIACAN